jgi:hypothetical protein
MADSREILGASMKNRYLLVFLLLTLPALAQSNQSQPDRAWILDQSTLTYHMSHPMHEVDGVSHAAKGKGVCHAGQCNFLLAVPVKSFDSGDSNRDLHMLQVTRGAQFPIVTVRLSLPETSLASATLDCDLEVQFAGNTAHYSHVPFTQVIEGTAHHIKGTVPSTLTDFKIDPPSFLTVPIKNEIPVRVDMVWHPSL